MSRLPLALLLAPLLMLSFAIYAPALHAQETPGVKAAGLIRELTKRSTLPPIEAQAQLEALEPDVARELGMQCATATMDTARRVTAFLAESNSSYAHAALLYSLASEDEEKKQLSLDMLAQLEFRYVRLLASAAEKLSPSLLQRVRDANFVGLLETYVADLCEKCGEYSPQGDDWVVRIDSQSAVERMANLRERQLCLALLIDAVEGEGGFRLLTDEILKHLVGEDTSEFLTDALRRIKEIERLQREAGEVEEEDADEDADDSAPIAPADEEAPQPLSEEEQARFDSYVLIERRRDGAQRVFRQLLLMDPDRSGRTLGNYTYAERKVCADGFWDDYQRAFGEPTTWIGHLEYLRRPNEFAEGAMWTTLLLMDELCGGVTVLPPPPKDEEGVDIAEPVPVAIFDGATPAIKIAKFESLTSSEQRARKKALREKFNELFKPAEDR